LILWKIVMVNIIKKRSRLIWVMEWLQKSGIILSISGDCIYWSPRPSNSITELRDVMNCLNYIEGKRIIYYQTTGPGSSWWQEQRLTRRARHFARLLRIKTWCFLEYIVKINLHRPGQNNVHGGTLAVILAIVFYYLLLKGVPIKEFEGQGSVK
jgi:hypothetical protein